MTGYATLNITTTNSVSPDDTVTLSRTFPTIPNANNYLVYLLSSNGFILSDAIGFFGGGNMTRSMSFKNVSSALITLNATIAVIGFRSVN